MANGRRTAARTGIQSQTPRAKDGEQDGRQEIFDDQPGSDAHKNRVKQEVGFFREMRPDEKKPNKHNGRAEKENRQFPIDG